MPTDTAAPDTGTVDFVEFHWPGLTDGDYTITLTQTVENRDKARTNSFAETFPVSTSTFSIAGERVALPPALIHALFPPPGSLGEHSQALPHVLLNRSTLPWERRAGGKASDDTTTRPPWLALLLFHEEEKPASSVVKFSDLLAATTTGTRWPGITTESGQSNDDQVTVIDVPWATLKNILPTWEDLQLLAHVRQGKPTEGPATEFAGVIGSRLPKPNGSSTVHLVSMEGRYTGAAAPYQFDPGGAADTDAIRLVSLANWTFACVDPQQTFEQLLTNLHQTSSTLQLPLPASASDEAARYLKMGQLPLPHGLRGGDTTYSWYHGPLGPVENPNAFTLPVRSADALVRYDRAVGMFDVSYAAAWELGRLLALQSKGFSVGLYQWKRLHAAQLKQAEQRLPYLHLPTLGPTIPPVDLPDNLAAWFENLSQLQGVPFNYLVPDEKMLPAESIRFFWMDDEWMECLLDGAFSIGRVTVADQDRDQGLRQVAADAQRKKITGCLLRSDVVANWPSLLVDAYDACDANDPSNSAVGTKLAPLRTDRLAPGVLLCLFDGVAQRVEVHQRPEALHFGLPEEQARPKSLRVPGVTPSDAPKLESADLPWRGDAAVRCLDITKLAATIASKLQDPSLNAATFAYQMIEGVEKVIFPLK